MESVDAYGVNSAGNERMRGTLGETRTAGNCTKQNQISLSIVSQVVSLCITSEWSVVSVNGYGVNTAGNERLRGTLGETEQRETVPNRTKFHCQSFHR